MNRPVLLLASLLVASVACAPPPEEPQDLAPCEFLRRQVCGAQDECKDVGADANACEQCKSALCTFVLSLQDPRDSFTCFSEWRSRPAYPVCRFPGPVATPPTPPFIYPLYCERDCSLIPYPPRPNWAP